MAANDKSQNKPEFEGVMPTLAHWLRGRRAVEIEDERDRNGLARAWMPIFYTFGGVLAAFVVAAWMVASVLPGGSAHLKGSAVFGVIALYFMAAATSGVAVGFLFAVPRVMATGGAKPKDSAAAPGGDTERAQHALLDSNSNLERISDWLTTAIIALSLANLKEVRQWLMEFGATAEKSLGQCTGTDCGGAISVTIQATIVFAGVWGLLLGYLHTRVFITLMFRDTEQEIRKPWQGEALFSDTSLQLKLHEGVVTDGDAAANLSEADRRKVEELAKRDIGKETVAQNALMVAQARLLVGKPVDAASAAERAERLAPQNGLIRSRAEEVKRRASETTDERSRDDQIIAAHDLLFSPGGYMEAIAISENLKVQGGALPANFYVNLACAYAQQFRSMQDSPTANPAALDQARTNVQTAVLDALRTGPQWRNRLRELYDRSFRPQSDKDLAVLRPDPVLDRELLPPADDRQGGAKPAGG